MDIGFALMASQICVASIVMALNLSSCVAGIKYGRPGSTSRRELTAEETCLMLSIMVPSSSQKIILECFPINSMTRVLWQRSPISFRCSIFRWMMRSIWGWVMLMIRPFAICLRKTIQNVGACRGLVLLVSVRYKKGREAFAEMDTRNCPLLPLHVKSSSSFSGCAILLIFVFKIVWFSSWTKPAITIPSKGCHSAGNCKQDHRSRELMRQTAEAHRMSSSFRWQTKRRAMKSQRKMQITYRLINSIKIWLSVWNKYLWVLFIIWGSG